MACYEIFLCILRRVVWSNVYVIELYLSTTVFHGLYTRDRNACFIFCQIGCRLVLVILLKVVPADRISSHNYWCWLCNICRSFIVLEEQGFQIADISVQMNEIKLKDMFQFGKIINHIRDAVNSYIP